MSASKKRSVSGATKDSVVMLRTAPEDKALIEKAANHLGLTVSSFVLQNSLRAARKELSVVESSSLSEKDALLFYSALENPPAPSKALIDAFDDHEKQSS